MSAAWSGPSASLFYFIPGDPPACGLRLSRSRRTVPAAVKPGREACAR
jgi:hypothetical protein